MMQDQANIKEIKTYTFPGMTAKVIIPDLTKEEYEFRHKQIYKASMNLLKDLERR